MFFGLVGFRSKGPDNGVALGNTSNPLIIDDSEKESKKAFNLIGMAMLSLAENSERFANASTSTCRQISDEINRYDGKINKDFIPHVDSVNISELDDVNAPKEDEGNFLNTYSGLTPEDFSSILDVFFASMIGEQIFNENIFENNKPAIPQIPEMSTDNYTQILDAIEYGYAPVPISATTKAEEKIPAQGDTNKAANGTEFRYA